MVTLEEVKGYLRVDFSDDDELITSLIKTSENLCLSVLRESWIDESDEFNTAVLYATAYLYEHREEADHKALTLTLRALLFGNRKVEF